MFDPSGLGIVQGHKGWYHGDAVGFFRQPAGAMKDHVSLLDESEPGVGKVHCPHAVFGELGGSALLAFGAKDFFRPQILSRENIGIDRREKFGGSVSKITMSKETESTCQESTARVMSSGA